MKGIRLQALLDEYVPSPIPPLLHYSPYTLLIAVVLSAHCTDARVNQVTPLLFAKASTPEEMVLIRREELECLLRPCGLSKKKAQYLQELSAMILADFHGSVPTSLEELVQLPGVGRKTASVVLTQAFEIPAFPVDTHIYRCAHRWGLSIKKSVLGVEEDLKKSFPRESWGRVHLQIIYYARTFCPARGHKIFFCPICSFLETRK